MKIFNFVLLILFGLIMLFGFIAMFTENLSDLIITIEYLRSVESTVKEIGLFIGGAIGFFAEMEILTFYPKDN